MTRAALACLIIAAVFWLGICWQKYHGGYVTILHNIDERSALNHGQTSIHVEFPHGVKFAYLRLGREGIRADQGWIEILPGRVHKTWFDSVTLETEPAN